MSTAVILVSNHRTGSGCLASILHTLGVPMIPTETPTMTGDDAWEDQDFVKLHRSILGEIVGKGYDPIAWRYPVPRFDDWTIAGYRDLLIEKSERPIWGFKDPRTVWMLDFVLGLTAGLQIDTRLVWLKRSTAAVADSLRRRDNAQWPTDHLSVAVHQRAEWERMRSRFVHAVDGIVIDYEELVVNTARTIQRLVDWLPITAPEAAIQQAISIVKR